MGPVDNRYFFVIVVATLGMFFAFFFLIGLVVGIDWSDYPEIGWIVVTLVIIAIGVHFVKSQTKAYTKRGRFRRLR